MLPWSQNCTLLVEEQQANALLIIKIKNLPKVNNIIIFINQDNMLRVFNVLNRTIFTCNFATMFLLRFDVLILCMEDRKATDFNFINSQT